jgi:hypothetical protein
MAAAFLTDPKAVKSLERHEGHEFIDFGQSTDPEGWGEAGRQ